jgi:hypothetical protein
MTSAGSFVVLLIDADPLTFRTLPALSSDLSFEHIARVLDKFLVDVAFGVEWTP